MLRIFRKLLGRGAGTPATDGGTAASAVSFEDADDAMAGLQERYSVDQRDLDPTLPADAADHFDGLLDETAPTPESYLPVYTAADVSAEAFVDAYTTPADAVVDAVFQQLREGGVDGAAVDHAERQLKTGMHAVVEDAATGVAAYETAAVPAGDSSDGGTEEELNVDDDALLDSIGMPVFMLDATGSVVAWNETIEELTGCSKADAMGMDHASEAFYPDDRRVKTLADKVIESPRSAAAEFDIERSEEKAQLYADTSVMTDQGGTDRHIRFKASPIFDDDGELLAVAETIEDRTEDVRRADAVEELVDELSTTIDALSSGRLSERASFEHEGIINEQLVSVVSALNGMADQFERLVGQVDGQTQELADTIERATADATDIADTVSSQNEMLSSAANEMENFSASMQEVAASSDQVASAAEQAQDAAESGLEASEGANQATNEVIDISDDLMESVSKLESRMDEIEDVVEVIAEVADQTNLLALNANIEAARAGEAGSGFAVVADEVKELANETREHTERIAGSISDVQQQANETVLAVEESHEQIHRAGDEIDDALTALEEIATSVDEAATGITEVARANDEQASTVEDVIVTIEDVQQQAEAAAAASDRIVSATQEQSTAVSQLSERVDKLTTDSQ
ncbi:methyl-accepting chemotaxis protein [Halobacterium salinarum]|uniref:methyl-accepting chemotaxis protein n=1 Tax=Halobacterium salinarum TaxID=2242 RepID=UPI002553EBAC|nr:methyl-accepting chemotaxis protein [Halobacterium salinarum]MDL0126074.1 methyl-accepting chemotaxis protein [Halobacterium salinarum]MDL0135435.1 methyl-accepting chemotaxis protein [Halobacterium salinarum]MDL0144439.1 methyl-accepting chemotaxis protein [Halobacterium salinarum]